MLQHLVQIQRVCPHGLVVPCAVAHQVERTLGQQATGGVSHGLAIGNVQRLGLAAGMLVYKGLKCRLLSGRDNDMRAAGVQRLELPMDGLAVFKLDPRIWTPAPKR